MADKPEMSVRDLIKALADCEDMDAGVSIVIFNGDPQPVKSVDVNEDGQPFISTD